MIEEITTFTPLTTVPEATTTVVEVVNNLDTVNDTLLSIYGLLFFFVVVFCLVVVYKLFFYLLNKFI